MFIDRSGWCTPSKATCGGQPSRCLFGGHRISAVVPAAVNPGNIGVSFDVLSYAGVLSVTAVADPDIVMELDPLTEALSTAFRRLIDAS